MKIIVSSKHLYQELSKIDFDKQGVNVVGFKKQGITLYTGYNSIDILADISYNEPSSMKQDNNRWDLILKLVSQIDDQPITLDIHEFKVEVIFNF